MSGKTFVDTNVLVYALDSDAGSKHRIAQEVVRRLWEQNSGIVSMQVLQELYSAVTRKLSKRVPRQEVRQAVRHFTQWCIATGPSEIAAAFQMEDAARISFWDAMIVAAAVRGGAVRILSEDLNAGQTIAGITIENPFHPG